MEAIRQTSWRERGKKGRERDESLARFPVCFLYVCCVQGTCHAKSPKPATQYMYPIPNKCEPFVCVRALCQQEPARVSMVLLPLSSSPSHLTLPHPWLPTHSLSPSLSPSSQPPLPAPRALFHRPPADPSLLSRYLCTFPSSGVRQVVNTVVNRVVPEQKGAPVNIFLCSFLISHPHPSSLFFLSCSLSLPPPSLCSLLYSPIAP